MLSPCTNSGSRRCHKIFFVLTLCLYHQITFAKSFPPSDSTNLNVRNDTVGNHSLIWLTIGGGIIEPSLLGGDIKITYAWNENSISAKVQGASSFSIFSPPKKEINEYGAYFGRQISNTWLLGRIAGGISYFTGRRGTQVSDGNGVSFNRSVDDIHNFGIGVELEGMIKYKYAGLSLMISTIACPKFIMIGMFVNLSVGKLE